MSTDTADSAIEHILSAEQQARDAVDECRRQADELVEQGLRRARRIAERADERIASVQARADRGAGLAIRRIEDRIQTLSEQAAVEPEDRARLRRAVESLVRELAGAAP